MLTLQLKLIIFVIVSAAFGWVSRKALRNRQSHGFYRFFGWEAILALVLLNVDRWFSDPFSTQQLVSWFLLSTSLILVVLGLQLLLMRGKPDSSREDEALFTLEKTTQLVTTGIYRYLRHPIYGALIYGAWGVFFKQPSWIAGLLALIATLFLTLTSKVEETENISYFGDEYREYMKRSKMFVPFLF